MDTEIFPGTTDYQMLSGCICADPQIMFVEDGSKILYSTSLHVFLFFPA